MNARRPRWEIVRGDAGWHARFRASNGQIILSSETYTRRRDAAHAVRLVRNADRAHYFEGRVRIEVRDVDERGQVTR